MKNKNVELPSVRIQVKQLSRGWLVHADGKITAFNHYSAAMIFARSFACHANIQLTVTDTAQAVILDILVQRHPLEPSDDLVPEQASQNSVVSLEVPNKEARKPLRHRRWKTLVKRFKPHRGWCVAVHSVESGFRYTAFHSGKAVLDGTGSTIPDCSSDAIKKIAEHIKLNR